LRSVEEYAGGQEQEGGENWIIKNFIICTPNHILSNQG
jgi:hypothetical protein